MKDGPRRLGRLSALVLILTVVTTGCQLTIKPAAETTPPGETKTLTGIRTDPVTDPGTEPVTAAATAGAEPQPVKRPGELALEKYREARSGVTSEKMVHLWSVESSYPFKSGENIMEWNVDEKGQPTTGRGSLKESYAGRESLTSWVLGPETFTVKSGEVTRRYPLEEVQKISRYDVGSLLETVLLSYPARQEGGNSTVRVTTQNEADIQSHLEELGYRKKEGAYAGNLFMEIILNASSGHLETINYEFSSSLEGYTDNGQITFSNWNVPVPHEPEAEGEAVEGPTTVEAQPAPEGPGDGP